MKRLLLMLLVAVHCSTAQAQQLEGQALVDSLQGALQLVKHDTDKVNIIDDIGDYYRSVDTDSAMLYANKFLEMAQEVNWQLGICRAYNQIALVYDLLEQYDETKDYYFRSLECYESRDDTVGMIMATANIGTVYDYTYKYSDALVYFIKSLDMARAIGDGASELSALIEIGNVYGNVGETEKSMHYYEQALEVNKKVGHDFQEALVLINMAVEYVEGKQYEKALELNKKAVVLLKKIDRSFAVAHVQQNIADIYVEQCKYKEAMEAFKTSGKEFIAADSKGYIVNHLLKVADLYYTVATDTTGYKPDGKILPLNKDENLKMSMQYLDNAKILFDTCELHDIMSMGYMHRMMAVVQKEYGKHDIALEHYTEYMKLKDSVWAQEDDKKIAELEGKIAVATKEKQIKLQEQLLDKKRNEIWYMIGGIVFLLVVLVIIFRNYRVLDRINKLLNIEKHKSEELLHNILPEEVASELKERGATTAQYFDRVTVIFTDFVNFSKASERMSSRELVDELHTCFKAFDEIMVRNGIEKIKTVGDAYLAVCGLPSADEHHAMKSVKAAQEVRAFMVDRYAQLGDKTFEVRIGVHSGEVVAGIVGVKKFAYDIWGDTVNTAARMEQNSEAGKINISQTTYELVQDKFTCTYRGELEAKNKGKLKMYFVEA